jgi:hypothetical protein
MGFSGLLFLKNTNNLLKNNILFAYERADIREKLVRADLR